MTTQLAPAPRKPRARHPLTTIPASVVGSTWITPRMTRLTIQSDQMAGFLRSDEPDQFATIIFPRPSQQLIDLSDGVDWDTFFKIPDEFRPEARNYTVRHANPAAGTIDVDILVHGGPGYGENWAANVQPGERIFLWGPRVAYSPFPNASFHLLFCDECGVPAAAHHRSPSPDAAGRLVAEVKDSSAIPPMPDHPGVALDWVFSGESEPGTGGRLLDAVASVPQPSGLVYAWGGGEMTAMQKIGRYLRKHWGLKTSSISAIGYWRIGP
ncbi:MAG: siderophore-interacting protein [Thermomicrobiales bacterium]